jgi:hypothetical protein
MQGSEYAEGILDLRGGPSGRVSWACSESRVPLVADGRTRPAGGGKKESFASKAETKATGAAGRS